MGTFDAYADAPGKLCKEAAEITVQLDRTSASTARISWNIPTPPDGCTAETQAYGGIVITLDNVGADKDTVKPTNETIYTGDPTGDRDLHAGDTIGTALVVGAFYECVKKGTGTDLTTYVDITGLDENTPYYVTGYAVDCQYRYCPQGSHAYSLDPCLTKTDDSSGYVTISFPNAITATDGTGLSLGATYAMDMQIDDVQYTITINGSNAQTYGDLVDAINVQIGLLVSASQSPVPPNTNAYYYNTTTEILYQWDGYAFTEVDAIQEPTDPTALALGDYWYKTSTSELYQWDGLAWVLVSSASIVRYAKDPTLESGLTSSDYWYRSGSPSAAFQWNGNIWDQLTLYDQTTDPSDGVTADAGYYWYNPDDLLLRHWNEVTCVWDETDALYWSDDPTALPTGTYWFDDGDNLLWIYDTPVADIWNPVGRSYIDFTLSAGHSNSDLALADGEYTEQITIAGNVLDIVVNVCDATSGRFDKVFASINSQLAGLATISFVGTQPSTRIRLVSADESEPVITAGGTLFTALTNYSTTEATVVSYPLTIGTEPTSPVANQYWINSDAELFIRNAGNTAWVSQCAIVYDTDPSIVASGDLWWNSDTDILYIWDSVASAWVQVEHFIQSTTDPTAPVSLAIGVVWYDGTTLSSWDGSQWIEVTFISSPTDPTAPAVSDIWYDTSTSKWYEWSGVAWVEFDPVDSDVDPSSTTIPSGTFWYDTTNNALWMWNGTAWMSVIFSTVSPKPDTGDLWYDTTTSTLMMWNGTTWVESPPLATATVSTDGTIVFTATSTGSGSNVDVGRSIADDEIFFSLNQQPTFSCMFVGTDGLSCLPTYEQEGIGTDGTEDEHRRLADDIRKQLGHPVVQVELTKGQLDEAIRIAIQELRRNSSAAYRRGFMKLYVNAGKQIYKLTKPTAETDSEGNGYSLADGQYGHDKIVQVMGCFRITSAFMTSAHGSGVFGQVVLQHLYNMGTFDLLSFHIVSQYIETLEHLFASRITFNWNESARSLTLHQYFSTPETILMDVAVERTEQDLLTDRFTGRWIERYALAHSKRILSQIRGKFASLPGAGGGVSLNASDLAQEANDEFEKLQAELDNYVVNNVEEYGMNCEFIIG